MALHLALALGRPLLVEGPAGVGKTEIAKALAAHEGARLIRLQCYEGLDAATTLYEWNYQRQLLAIRAGGADEEALFTEKYLLKRPLLEAITQAEPPVLLIDEVDRADEEFEAYLLEMLAEFQVTMPELGTITAVSRPVVILTSNGARELSDALRRRCLYAYVDYPDLATELAILPPARRGSRRASRGRSSAWCRRCGARSWRRSPGSPRCSTGRRRWPGSGSTTSRDDPGTCRRASSACSRPPPTATRCRRRCSRGWSARSPDGRHPLSGPGERRRRAARGLHGASAHERPRRRPARDRGRAQAALPPSTPATRGGAARAPRRC
jgi:hypothetical protein